MSEYRLSWITQSIAAGSAPMSYGDLESIKAGGINAIVNLCAEYSDLHEIEEKFGFEVFHLPIWDEDVPDIREMEKALEWLDEAVYIGKKVLIHCRFGIGRTGTFITSYLVRRGLGLKQAAAVLKKTRATPTSYNQNRLLKKYQKKSGVLKIREPSLESRHEVDLSIWFNEYEALVARADEDIAAALGPDKGEGRCGSGFSPCCFDPFVLPFMEVIYISHKINRVLTSQKRIEIIETAVDLLKNSSGAIHRPCPFNQKDHCLVYPFRPLRCRLYGLEEQIEEISIIKQILNDLSKNVFLALSGQFWEQKKFEFSVAQTVSGKYVQTYFELLNKVFFSEKTHTSVEN